MPYVTFTSNVGAFIEAMNEQVSEGLKDIAEDIKDEASSLAPVRKTTPGQQRFHSYRSYSPKEVKALTWGTKSFGGTMRFKAKPFGMEVSRVTWRRPMTRTKPETRKAEYSYSLAARTFTRESDSGLNSRGKAEKRLAFAEQTPAQASQMKPGDFIGSRKAVQYLGWVSGKKTFEMGGFLRKSIVVGEVENDNGVSRVSVISKAPYSRYVEFPTRRTRAQPFMMPAIKLMRNHMKTTMKGYVQTAIKQG